MINYVIVIYNGWWDNAGIERMDDKLSPLSMSKITDFSFLEDCRCRGGWFVGGGGAYTFLWQGCVWLGTQKKTIHVTAKLKKNIPVHIIWSKSVGYWYNLMLKTPYHILNLWAEKYSYSSGISLYWYWWTYKSVNLNADIVGMTVVLHKHKITFKGK